MNEGQTERNWHLWSEGGEKCDLWGQGRCGADRQFCKSGKVIGWGKQVVETEGDREQSHHYT